MKINCSFLIAVFCFCLLPGNFVNAQNNPEIGTIPDAYLFSGGTTSYVFLPALSDGDNNTEVLTIEAESSDNQTVGIGEIIYSSANTTAVLELIPGNLHGTATVTVTITDSDNTVEQQFNVTVGPYTNSGVTFEIHDIIFWQEVIPLSGISVFDTVIQTTEAPYDKINFDALDITVNEVKDDFFTGLFKGYLIPPTTGEYRFSILKENNGGVWLGNSYADAEPLAVQSDKHGSAGMVDSGNSKMKVSGPITLEAGKAYAFYGVQWIVHATYGGILWEGPGIERSYIPGQYLLTEYDTVKPNVPPGLEITQTGVNYLRFKWGRSNDNKELKGYNIYLDGVLQNDLPQEDLHGFIDQLIAGTKYSLAVTAVDMVGNESAPSEIVTLSTYPEDDQPPSPPTSASVVVQSGLALQITWEGALDAETAISGYHVYVDGMLYNTAGAVLTDTIIIGGLAPERGYDVTIESVDAGGNVSAMSEVFVFSTSAYDPLANNLGMRSGTFSFNPEPVSFSYGVGVNPNYKGGEVFNSSNRALLDDLKPGAIRWGALTANPLKFRDYRGPGKAVTIGKFMNLCNEVGAYTVFCCGVDNSTDWRADENTFLHFLEYLAGPAGTTSGDLRIAEGFENSLLEDSPGLIFEFGNEVWGGESHNAEIGKDYDAYAQWCRDIATLMKASEYYDPDKIMLAYSGRYPNPQNSYGLNDKLIEGDTGEVDLLAVSGYLGGNLDYDPAIDPGDSELDYYKNALGMVALNLEGMEHYAKMTLLESDAVKSTYLYESNTTTPAYNGRMGQAVVSTDYYLSAMRKGSVIPTIFHLTGGQWKITDPNNGYKRLPLFETAKLVNRFCKGFLLSTDYTTSNEIYNSNGELVALDPVGVHAFQSEGNYTLVMASRDFSSDHTVMIDLPDGISPSATAMLYTVTADGFSSRDAVVDSTEIEFDDGMFFKVPKHGMVFINFKGNAKGSEPFPSLGTFPYIAQTSIEITGESLAITEDRGRLELFASYEPENSFADQVKWELLDNTIGVEIIEYKTSCKLKSSGKCDGNGTIRVRAVAPGNPTVFDEVEIDVSGQINPECSSVETFSDEKFAIFPIPSKNQVTIDVLQFAPQKCIIYSIDGKTVYQQSLKDARTVLTLDQLTPGTYFVEVETSNGSATKRLILM